MQNVRRTRRSTSEVSAKTSLLLRTHNKPSFSIKSVFVYVGASCTEQAAINLVLNIKSQVLDGHLNVEDQKFVISNYPTIPKNQFISASGILANRILVQTKRKGVDLLISNADNLSKIQSCCTCIKNGPTSLLLEIYK